MTRERPGILPSGWAGWRPVLFRIAVVLVVLALLVGLWTLLPVAELVAALQRHVAALGALGFGLFALFYVLFTLVIGPAALLSACAGLVWGPIVGLAAVLCSATLASVVAALVGRHLARARVQALVEKDRRLHAVMKAVAVGSWRIVMLLRLSPLLPFGVQNYLLAMTDVKLLPYTWATALGILPSSALFVYLGSLGGNTSGAGPLRWVLLIMGLAATALVVFLVTRLAQKALDQATASENSSDEG